MSQRQARALTGRGSPARRSDPLLSFEVDESQQSRHGQDEPVTGRDASTAGSITKKQPGRRPRLPPRGLISTCPACVAPLPCRIKAQRRRGSDARGRALRNYSCPEEPFVSLRVIKTEQVLCSPQ
jgi:hypothetical protein